MASDGKDSQNYSVSGKDLGPALLEALGIKGRMVRGLELRVFVDESVQVTITELITGDRADGIRREITNFVTSNGFTEVTLKPVKEVSTSYDLVRGEAESPHHVIPHDA